MSATLIGNNVTVKINGAVSGTATASGGSATIYTAPANGYAIVNVCIDLSGSAGSITVAGRKVLVFNSGFLGPIAASSFVAGGFTVYVGPSQALAIVADAAGYNRAVASGVEFINSP